ncbi:hypothetical protein [Streptomyces sp. NPDC054783]
MSPTYVWAVAHGFRKPGTTEAEAWAVNCLTAILAGQVAHAADEMTDQPIGNGSPPPDARHSRPAAAT